MRPRSFAVVAAAIAGFAISAFACGPSYRRVADPMPGSAAILPSPVIAEEVPTSEPSVASADVTTTSASAQPSIPPKPTPSVAAPNPSSTAAAPKAQW